MWRLKNWARIVTLALAGLVLAAGPMSLLLISSDPAGLVMTAARRGVAPFVKVVSFFLVGVPWEISLTVSAFLCWYLLRPAVEAAFEQGQD
jgi:ABC-type multidrug transport system permease subunit